eukprot:s6520_g5.t1
MEAVEMPFATSKTLIMALCSGLASSSLEDISSDLTTNSELRHERLLSGVQEKVYCSELQLGRQSEQTRQILLRFCSCEADMQWRARIGSEEFWATFPPLSPRPEVGSGGLVPIRLNASLRLGARPGLPEKVQGAQCAQGAGEKRSSQRSCRPC